MMQPWMICLLVACVMFALAAFLRFSVARDFEYHANVLWRAKNVYELKSIDRTCALEYDSPREYACVQRKSAANARKWAVGLSVLGAVCIAISPAMKPAIGYMNEPTTPAKKKYQPQTGYPYHLHQPAGGR